MHFTLREVCELDELEAIVKLVENGVGVALVPQIATHQEWPAGVRVLDLGQHTFHRDIGLVHRARQSLTEPVRTLAQLISDQVKTGSE
jgi:DNA-binding transcriptional LysR family regulator